MMFKDAQVGMPIYIFDRNDLCMKTEKISSVVPPHFDANMPSGKMAVDITCDSLQKYAIEDCICTAYFNNCAISLDKEAILREIELMKNNSEIALAETARHEEIVDKCTQLLVENNPALREKCENEKRFNSIENSIGELKSMVETFIQKMS